MIDYKKIINEYTLNIKSDVRNLVNALLFNKDQQSRYIFGRNDLSLQLSKIIDIDGFIDDYAPSESNWHGRPVFSLDQISRDAIIVNCVINSRPKTALSRIRGAGFLHILSYSDLCRALPDLVPLPDFVVQTRQDIDTNLEKWGSVFENLADAESRAVLNDVLHYRLTADHTALANYTFRPMEQYFEEFMAFDKEVFVDAGGFDGDTTEQFCLRYSDYKKVYLFEPSINNIESAKKRLAQFHSINFIEKGVSNEPGVLYLNSNEGSSCTVSATGISEINVTTIDLHIDEKVSFIKMDLEGWEINAIHGTRNHIMNDHPKLAIAVYHRSSDIWGIFDLVRSFRKDYRVYLRHYTESWTETIMFFAPIHESIDS
jgi:FkbM family methyltransferase